MFFFNVRPLKMALQQQQQKLGLFQEYLRNLKENPFSFYQNYKYQNFKILVWFLKETKRKKQN